MHEYISDGHTKNCLTIGAFISIGKSKGKGSLPIAEGSTNTEAIAVGQDSRAVVTIGPTGMFANALPLLTCAAVVLAAKGSNKISLFHALSGSLDKATIQAMYGDLGSNIEKKDLMALYAAPEELDPGYRRNANKLIEFGVPVDRALLVQITPCRNFGVNNLGQVGV